MELRKIYESVVINALHIQRSAEGFSVSFAFDSSAGADSVTLFGVREIDSICELLNAQRIWIEEIEDAQLEFGRFILGISQECYTAIIFDRFDNEGA